MTPTPLPHNEIREALLAAAAKPCGTLTTTFTYSVSAVSAAAVRLRDKGMLFPLKEGKGNRYFTSEAARDTWATRKAVADAAAAAAADAARVARRTAAAHVPAAWRGTSVLVGPGQPTRLTTVTGMDTAPHTVRHAPAGSRHEHITGITSRIPTEVPFVARTGSHDHLYHPSRMGDRLQWPDGRTTTMPGATAAPANPRAQQA